MFFFLFFFFLILVFSSTQHCFFLSALRSYFHRYAFSQGTIFLYTPRPLDLINLELFVVVVFFCFFFFVLFLFCFVFLFFLPKCHFTTVEQNVAKTKDEKQETYLKHNKKYSKELCSFWSISLRFKIEKPSEP